MIYRQSSIDIIKAVVQAMTFPVTITEVVVNGNIHTIKTCDIYHAQQSFSVEIGGEIYTIDGISGTNMMAVIGTTNSIQYTFSVPQTFDLYKPFFFHGTPIAQGTELNQKDNAFDKIPMVWMYEQFTDTFNEEENNTIEREIKMRLFFLSRGNHEEWLTEEAYHQGIEPMRRLAENFVNKLKSFIVGGQKRFNTDNLQYDIINYAKFGVFISNKGTEKQLWADNLSGCELAITLPVNRINPCIDCPDFTVVEFIVEENGIGIMIIESTFIVG